jgi:hypothetical protein
MDSNLPKLLEEDIPIFLAITKDLFPTIEIKKKISDEIKEAVEKTMS